MEECDKCHLLHQFDRKITTKKNVSREINHKCSNVRHLQAKCDANYVALALESNTCEDQDFFKLSSFVQYFLGDQCPTP